MIPDLRNGISIRVFESVKPMNKIQDIRELSASAKHRVETLFREVDI